MSTERATLLRYAQRLAKANRLADAVEALDIDFEMVADYASNGYGFEVYQPAALFAELGAALAEYRAQESPGTGPGLRG